MDAVLFTAGVVVGIVVTLWVCPLRSRAGPKTIDTAALAKILRRPKKP